MFGFARTPTLWWLIRSAMGCSTSKAAAEASPPSTVLQQASPQARRIWATFGQPGALMSEKAHEYMFTAVKTHADANARSCP